MGAVATLTVAQDVMEPGVRTLTTPESQKVLDTMKHVETDQSYSSIIFHVWRTAWVWILITGRFCWPRLLRSQDSTYQCRGVGTYMSEIERLKSIQTGIVKVESTVCGMCVKSIINSNPTLQSKDLGITLVDILSRRTKSMTTWRITHSTWHNRPAPRTSEMVLGSFFFRF